jgi:hypothetical protein
MVRVIFAAVVALAVLFPPQPTKAYEFPWCAVIKDGDHRDCHYRSFEECRPNVVAGNRGFCNPNPYFVAGASESGRSEKHPVRQR